ncbi:MAG: hypothetical protein SFX72_07465 [Isosphaeraceae bacterium]|nr:hypothetical protein [Isosphaeraceae bacterium]
MRLTLRTLLAWMDDTLSAAEVREIGKQLAESPKARELAERINRVARQRRLTVPGETQPDGVDPNIVAAYLDNELGAEEVAALEKLCLTSDVHLAEVASVHQILSLIGQKAKVPPEARHRMYRLVKGRESASRRSKRYAPSHDEIETARPGRRTAPPTPTWGTGSTIARRTLLDRFGLPATVLGLLGLLVFAAFKSMEAPGGIRSKIVSAPATVGGVVVQNDPAEVDPEAAERARAEAARRAEAEAKQKMEALALAEAEKAKAAETPEPPAPARPAASIAKIEGVLLSSPAPGAAWTPAAAMSEWKPGETLINLSRGWSILALGELSIVLPGPAEIGLEAAADDAPVHPRMVQGEALIRGLAREKTALIDYRGKRLTISGSTASTVGLEVRPQSLDGTADVAPATLYVAIPDGEATLQWAGKTTKLSGASSVGILPNDEFADSTRGEAPARLTDAGPSAFDAQQAEAFAQVIRPGRPVVASLVEASESEDKEIRRLAISALGALGSSEMVVPILNETTDPTARAAAIVAIRAMLARDPGLRKSVRAELERTFGENADLTEKLLAGYTATERKEEATIAALVGLLTAPDLGTRALAIDTLQAITERDAMGYDPTAPEGAGLNNWKQLISRKEPKKAGASERVPPPPSAKPR